MGFADIILLLGGIALFLFGMGLMGDGLKNIAGSQMEIILYRLSGTPLKGLLLGAGVTAVIQSSSATSVMLVGFVNSGMMKPLQALSVIHGALIGTSITGWIICLSYLGESGGIASLLSTSTIAALFAIIGILAGLLWGYVRKLDAFRSGRQHARCIRRRLCRADSVRCRVRVRRRPVRGCPPHGGLRLARTRLRDVQRRRHDRPERTQALRQRTRLCGDGDGHHRAL